MTKLPDMEALAIFARVAEAQSFSEAAVTLGLSKATVSKAVSRLEVRLGTTLMHRTSRRFALTEAGRLLAQRAAQMTADAEAAECEAMDQALLPRGIVRLAAPMSFGKAFVAPALPDFLSQYPDVSIDLHLSDQLIDLVGGGFDCALRIAALADSSLLARRLRKVSRYLVAAPAYLKAHGIPQHPNDLTAHACLRYAYLATPNTWHFTRSSGEEATVRLEGPLGANNADALVPAALAGLGIAELPDFIHWQDVAAGRLVVVLPEWSLPEISLHLVAPGGGGPRPTRVTALMDFLAQRFSAPLWPGDRVA